MIDTHCHLTDSRLASQLDFVITRATLAGVTRLITIGTGIDESRRCIELCRGRENVRCTVGVHPGYVHEEQFEDLPQLRQLAVEPSVVAIGEIGLDYFRGKESRARQLQFLGFQLDLASQLNKPLVIHCREAVDDCLAVLAEFPGLRMVFHCFTGTLPEARRILDAGYLLGFTGPITYKKSDELREVAAYTPMDRMLVETDSPYLTPEPMRKQKVNEPALVMHVAARVAELKRLSIAEVDAITTANASRLFGWPVS
jgi:TatD DNase family protein